jgi:hypothetical protein
MNRLKKAVAPQSIIKLGGLYRDTVRGVTVMAEDHEIEHGHRTGRIIVRAADGRLRFPRRWYCRAEHLVDVQGELGALDRNDDGVHP